MQYFNIKSGKRITLQIVYSELNIELNNANVKNSICKLHFD